MPPRLPPHRPAAPAFASRTLLCGVVWVLASPVFAQQSPPAAQVEFFEKHVRPVLVRHCYECHSATEDNGGLRVDSRQALLTGGDSGPAIIPGKPGESLLIEAVRYGNRDLQMPPRNALSPDQVSRLEEWIAMGAPDPRRVPVEPLPAMAGMSIEDGRRFWSFRPPAQPPLPAVERQSWIRSPVDAFVLARLEAAGLTPAPPSDKRTLIRRVTFDLIGLPPTPEQVDQFLADDSPDAFRKVVDRLLQSPHYGVRWGRHWLDVARYADSNGLDENLAFGNAWRYRDYVVNAFNSDKPFNEFVVEQLAGDLLPDASPDTQTATGFLVLGAKVLAEPDMDKLRMDTIDEQIDTTGKVFLGLTLGCARCHDHKFDPIRQRDYYALAAIFRSTRTFADTKTGVIKHWYEHSFATPEDRERLKSVDAAIAAKKKAAADFKNKAMAAIRDAARERAADYLAAATQFDPSTPLKRVARIAQPMQLHPRILHHCRLHLSYNEGSGVFRTWHESSGNAAAVRQHYRQLFDRVRSAMADEKKGAAGPLSDPELDAARAALFDASGFLAVPAKPEFAFDAETLAEYYRLEEDARVLESAAPDEPAAMGVADGDVVSTLPIHIRGSHLNLGEPVPRGFPAVLTTGTTVLPSDHSGRLELAHWLAQDNHPLTSRVWVNRVWGWHFGRPIVRSTENFGALGDPPTHPMLLDWLACEFVRNNWSTRDLHRTIVLSSTYQMAHAHDAAAAARNIDPENRLLWRFPLQRLEAEEIRDAVLAISGRLQLTLGGKTVPLRNRQFVFNHTSVDHTRYDSTRRAIYLPIIRNNLYSLFEQFDFPNPTMPTGHRTETVVAPQALLMMNSELMLESADRFASRLADYSNDPVARVDLAYRLAFARPPTSDETSQALQFIGGADDYRTWSLFCQSLFAANEFLYLR